MKQLKLHTKIASNRQCGGLRLEAKGSESLLLEIDL
jgi:hypothetical protein